MDASTEGIDMKAYCGSPNEGKRLQNPTRRFLSLGCFILLFAGCISVGEEFRTLSSEMIKDGVTTRAELLRLLGSPTRVGVENGEQTWTWVDVRVGGMSRTLPKELHVKFTRRGIVKSHSYTARLPEEVQWETRWIRTTS